MRDRDLLHGTIVHIEYIDRGKIAEKSVTEAYRIPSVRHVARIRLVVGDTSPCTVYIGRPTFESKRFENDILKSAHTIAAACSAMFGLGIADCKIAMDGMTASEAVQFMRAVSGNTIRDRYTQRLSAAFNLNTPLTDDRIASQNPVSLTENFAIAKCSIVLTRKGHFDKVTWDGAADGPSLPLIPNQLKELRLLELVHEAHGNGLETYISAGMDADNMRSVTAAGVGGVGIGTKLHFRDPNTLAIGRINAEEVRKVLENRDFAAPQPPGKAAEALARLDWFFHDLNQSDALEFLRKTVQDLRSRLYESLKAYWQAATDGARIATHKAIQEQIQGTDSCCRDGVRRHPKQTARRCRADLLEAVCADLGNGPLDIRVGRWHPGRPTPSRQTEGTVLRRRGRARTGIESRRQPIRYRPADSTRPNRRTPPVDRRR